MRGTYMNIIKKISKIIDSKIVKLPEAKCWNCNSLIFNMNSHFGKMGLCVNCYTAYKMGKESITNKYPEQVLIECQTCRNITTCRNRPTERFETNKTSLCCNNPDYLYYIKEYK